MQDIDKTLGKEGVERLVELRSQKLTYEAIANILNDEFGTTLDRQKLSKYLDRRSKTALKIMKGSVEYEKKITDEYFNTVKSLNTLKDEMWKEYYKLKEDPMYKTSTIDCPHCSKSVKIRFKTADHLIKMADHLLKQIQHTDAVLGRLKKASTLNVTYNIGDMTNKIIQVMPQILDKWESKGYVQVKRKNLIKDMAVAYNDDILED